MKMINKNWIATENNRRKMARSAGAPMEGNEQIEDILENSAEFW